MDQVTLITRPRRFGKTMAMSMLNSFLDIRKDSRELFEGLEISKETAICERWMNQYPTLFLSFKDVYGSTFENTFNFLKYIVVEVCKQHMYLLDSDDVDKICGAFFILPDILQKQGNVMQRDWLS